MYKMSDELTVAVNKAMVHTDNSTNKRREGVKLHEVVVNRRGLIEA